MFLSPPGHQEEKMRFGSIAALLLFFSVGGCTSYNDFTMGLGQIRQGNYDQAIEHLNSAIRKNHKEADYYSIRGYAYIRKREYGLAESDLAQAIKLDKKNHFAWFVKGELDYDQGNYHSAIGNFSRAINLMSDNPYSLIGRGKAYRKLGLYKSALASLNEAIRLDPNNFIIFFIRGVVYANSGDIDSARDEFESILRKKPVWVQHYLARGMAYRGLGKYQMAINELDPIIKKHPKNIPALFHKAKMLTNTLRPKRAIQIYSRLLKIIPKDYVYFNNRGYNYCLIKQYVRCIEDLDHAIQLYPDFTPAFLNRSKAHLALQKKGKAEKDLQKARESTREGRKNFMDWLDDGVDIFIETPEITWRYSL